MKHEEIKFRGRLINGDWVFGLLAHPTGKVMNGGEKSGNWYICNSVGRPFAYEVRPETIGLFSTLRAEKGVEIYEGDIVIFDNTVKPDVERNKPYEVKFKEGKFVVEDFGKLFDLCDYESFHTKVIGNVHEHKELLNK